MNQALRPMPDNWTRALAVVAHPGPALGVRHAVAFGQIRLLGV